MNALLLLLSLAGPAHGGELPVDALVALGLDAPTTSEHVEGWRAALPDGGLVKGYTAPNEERAKQHFEAQLRTAQAGVWPQAELPGLSVDQAVGDGTVSVLVRQGATVLYIRDLNDDAAGWAAKILPLLVAEPAKVPETAPE